MNIFVGYEDFFYMGGGGGGGGVTTKFDFFCWSFPYLYVFRVFDLR